ncbi:MAG: hypothetical protein GY679_03030 [Mycoplasma sp.]|nr:hypothetical protein [Mycoplasma sp.]
MNKNKMMLGALTAIIGVATPIATVVSCGKNKKEEKIINLDINIDKAFANVKEKIKSNTKANGELKNKNDKGYINPMEAFGEEIISQLFKSLGKTSNVAKVINDKLNQKNEKSETFLSLIGKEISGIFAGKIIPHVLDSKNEDNRTIAEFIKKDFIPAISDFQTKVNEFKKRSKEAINNIEKDLQTKKQEKTDLEKTLSKTTKDEEKSKINKKIDDLKNEIKKLEDNMKKVKDVGGFIVYIGSNIAKIEHSFEFSTIKLIQNLLDSFGNSNISKLIDKAKIKPKEIIDLVSNLNNSKIKVNISYKGKTNSLTSSKLSINKTYLTMAKGMLKTIPTVEAFTNMLINLGKGMLDKKGDKEAGVLSVLFLNKPLWKKNVKKTSYIDQNDIENITNKLIPWIKSTGLNTIKSLAESLVRILENKPFSKSEGKPEFLKKDNLKELREQFKLLGADNALSVIDMIEELVSLYIPK